MEQIVGIIEGMLLISIALGILVLYATACVYFILYVVDSKPATVQPKPNARRVL